MPHSVWACPSGDFDRFGTDQVLDYYRYDYGFPPNHRLPTNKRMNTTRSRPSYFASSATGSTDSSRLKPAGDDRDSVVFTGAAGGAVHDLLYNRSGGTPKATPGSQ
jgi:hypothetical protein